MALLNELRNWRNNQARIEGVEGYRVLSNTVLETLVGSLPENKEEMLAVKGIKEAKFRKYGAVLLGIIREHTSESVANDKRASGNKKSLIYNEINHLDIRCLSGGEQELSVSQFLDGLNIELSGMAARIRGEVSSVDARDRVVYFTLKDGLDESTLNCLIFRNQYMVSGVELAIGDEIIVEGVPDIYKPSGRLSLKVGMIELCGEGALKKAYDVLKKKLEEEGIFAVEKKRTLPPFPTRIALITSEQGAAIGDFTMNLGAQGMKVDFYPTSVEGKKAVFEIIEALKYFNAHAGTYDVLVMIRGGGSFESLQAFNNEALVREVALCKIPTLLGVGHEKDVTLAALAADVMVSTPTATARTLCEPWDEARQRVKHFEKQLPVLFEQELLQVKRVLMSEGETLLGHLGEFLEYANTLRQTVSDKLTALQVLVHQKLSDLTQGQKSLEQGFFATLEGIKKELAYGEDLLRQYDPIRVLKLGYSLVKIGKQLIKDARILAVGDILEIRPSQGKIEARVEKIILE